MSLIQSVVVLVLIQRLGELVYARANATRLLAASGFEVGAGHYPFLVVLHAGWLGALYFLISPAAAANWWLLGFFVLLQAGRVWVMASLGRRWTTRILVVPGAPLVRRGPYRILRHPNYLIVALEIATLPLAFGAWEIALVFSVANAALLAHRIRVENRALASLAHGTHGPHG